ncbi:MAG: DUF3011 domain-containing protein [Proteobacteria bacterium]|jgi:hypothetical protein|nr:DUF3011 domain-containing protein [Pseudomonadota bacterium]
MTSRTLLSIASLAAGIGLAIGPANVALAQKANSLRDLVGARAAGGESDLESRGYHFITGAPAYGGGKAGFWWNPDSRACVRVETFDGKFRSITDATGANCNQHTSGSNNERNTAAAIIGAAAIAAAIAHKNNAHDNKADSGGQYDLGYNDGLHDAPYYNPGRSDAYSSGYQAGVDQRSRNISYHGGTGGYDRVDHRPAQVTCTSVGGKYTECAIPGGGDIVMKQQLSKANCTKNETWGETGDGVYVKDGCRAIFEAMP